MMDGTRPPETTDILILGGGSAGCVLANRLTERPDLRVTLVEAGPDLRVDAQPPEIRSAYPSRAFFTRSFFQPDLFARFADVATVPPRERPMQRYEQARVLGGGSTINGLVGNRGAPTDYDAWHRMGATGWTWESVLPYFRKLERDLDFADDWHGQDGPVPISRMPADRRSGFVRAMVEALAARGYARIEDQNGAWGDGVLRVTTTIGANNERASAAICYLTPQVRARPNLRLITGTQAERLLIEGGRVVGAVLATPAGQREVRAGRVIVACGTIFTPALLMRSGLGPADHLRQHGIEVVRDLPGVGQNLNEHPALGISCFVRPGSRHLDQTRHHTQAHLRFSSRMEGTNPGDLTMAVIARSAWHAVGGQIATCYLWINQVFSRGAVRLASPDPGRAPEVDFRLLSDERDLLRMRAAVRHMVEIARDPALDRVRDQVFPMSFSDRVRKVSAPTRANAVQTGILAGLLDMAGPLRAALIRQLIAPVALDDILRDDATLDAFLDRAVVGVWHPVGTCRMGAADDPLAVTDPAGRVHGVPGLRICDASLMPAVPSANTNIPTIMLAERIADLIKSDLTQTAEAHS